MHRKITGLLTALVFIVCVATSAQADIFLADYGFNIDGSLTEASFGDPIPAAVDASSFDFASGLGTIDVTITGAGNHSFVAFFDHEIDEATNTFFNEFGSTSGAPASGQSWEIDDPFGFIYGDFLAGALFDDNYVPAAPNDVSLALGWNFTLASGEQALISLALGTVLPGSGFFLEQRDPDDVDSQGNPNTNPGPTSIYLSSTLEITAPPVAAVPVPAALWLFASGIAGLAGLSRRKPDT